MSADIVLIADPRVLAIPIQDNDEPLVDLKNFGSIFGVQDARSTLVRASVSERLQSAAKLLPEGLRFRIREGHRSLTLQKEYFEEYRTELKTAHPDWNDEMLRTETSKFVAPPDSTPPHSTAAALDLTIETVNGEVLEMETKLNESPEASRNDCYTYAENISDIAKQHRKILIDALTQSGFVNYPTEWWHWSYGDRYWAFMTNRPFALYGSVEEPQKES